MKDDEPARGSTENALSEMLRESVALSQRLHRLLGSAQAIAGPDFSGVGVIVSDRSANLPLFPLRPRLALDQTVDADRLLASISVEGGPLHDGFHVLSSDLQVSAVSQYFSPPIIDAPEFDRSLPIGGRYLAALFGSSIDGVLATGIATRALGIFTFVNGREASREMTA